MNKILVIDDERSFLVLAGEILNKSIPNCKVLTTRSGIEGIKIAKAEQPDTILLDVVMPEIDGYEVCEKLKADEQTNNIPIILVSMFQKDTDSRVLGLKSGADVFLSKPFDPTELSAQVSSMLRIRKAEKSLQQNVQQLKEHNEDLDAFSHTVAHDLKNPINAISGFSGLLRKEYTQLANNELENFLNIIISSTERLQQIIDSLLKFASVRKEEVSAEEINMGSIVKDAIQRFAMIIKNSNAEIKISESWPSVMGFAPWIEEVWVNYLSNAIKYGGSPPQIEIGVDTLKSENIPDGMVRFWVRDNGSGISAENQKLLFKKFERLDQVKTEGHGLGLSIVRRIIEKLGGQVGVESNTGSKLQGSVFYFTLPRST